MNSSSNFENEAEIKYRTTGLPRFLQQSIDEFLDGRRRNVTHMDCLWGELYGSINSCQWDDTITKEQADYLRNKYLFGSEDGESEETERFFEKDREPERVYILMHREVKVAEIVLNEIADISAVPEIYSPEHLPMGTMLEKENDFLSLARWWQGRTIPKRRKDFEDILEQLEMILPQELAEKSFGLSLSDQYWICPKGENLSWKDLNFFDNDFSEDVGDLLFGYKEVSENMNLISPDNTTVGQMQKRWKIVDGKRVLIKGSTNPYQYEALNEVIASRIANRLGINHVDYSVMWEDDEPFSVCENFITSETELIPAYHVIKAQKKPDGISLYEFYIACGEKLGITDIRQQTEKMLVLDFLIGNSDRHYNNFGLIRNAVTLEWIGVAPIFDCGASLWCNTHEMRIDPTNSDLWAKPFKKTHAEQIKLVQDFSWMDMESLDGIEQEMDEILQQSPYISEERRKVLCDALTQRIELLRELVMEQTQEQKQEEQTIG